MRIYEKVTKGLPLLACLALTGAGCGSDEPMNSLQPTTTGNPNLGSTSAPTTGTTTGGTTGTTTGSTAGTTTGSTAGSTTAGMSDGGTEDGGGDVGTTGPPVNMGDIPECLAGITNFYEDGPFSVTQETSGKIKMWIPDTPAGCKVPMIHISNGTGASCSFYGAAIDRYASHGFITLCYEDTNTGAGEFGIEAFDAALAMFPDKADMKFGSSGHSQGGQAAFVTGQYAEEKWPEGVHAILAVQPASGFGDQPKERWQTIYGKITQPTAMHSGNPTDSLVSKGWVTDAYKALPATTEAYHWSKSGANHFSPNGDTLEMGIPWWRWKLLGDQDACRAFKEASTKFDGWEVVGEQNQAECQ